MPITREALARLERIFDALEEAHEAELKEETFAMTDAEIEAELRAWGVDPNKLVDDLKRQLRLRAGNVKKVRQRDRDGASEKGPMSHRGSRRLRVNDISRDRGYAPSKSTRED